MDFGYGKLFPMKNRTIKTSLSKRLAGPLGHLVLVMGARQTGKTTLLRHLCADYAYVSFDDPVVRPQLSGMSAADWLASYRSVILDEVQKAPSMFETVKAMVDSQPDCRVVLSGSSQIMLMERVKESLAGRVSIFEMYPLTLPEMRTEGWDDPLRRSRLCRFLEDNNRDSRVLSGIPQMDDEYAKQKLIWERYLKVGAMPLVWKEPFTDNEADCHVWLYDYVRTYLQRDLRDLVMLRELEPFVLAQKAVAARTAGVLNASNLARDAQISPSSARRFLNYLEISYQIIQLRPWFGNPSKRLVKSPKIHMLDPGVMRAILGKREKLSGAEFESAVVAEVIKQVKSLDIPAAPCFLRTHDGLELDLLLEMEDGFIPIEIKQSDRVTRHDARHLFGIQTILNKPVIMGLLLSNDPRVQSFSDKVMAIPVAWALG